MLHLREIFHTEEETTTLLTCKYVYNVRIFTVYGFRVRTPGEIILKYSVLCTLYSQSVNGCDWSENKEAGIAPGPCGAPSLPLDLDT
jgi:hypothetical protein